MAGKHKGKMLVNSTSRANTALDYFTYIPTTVTVLTWINH